MDSLINDLPSILAVLTLIPVGSSSVPVWTDTLRPDSRDYASEIIQGVEVKAYAGPLAQANIRPPVYPTNDSTWFSDVSPGLPSTWFDRGDL
ncbi:hypothetical protein EDD15DRAFT_205723 [Pisolithus albus]|nr:hypothetical protein EDD15DRAFT_205723 [Pisolithus albus]